jgi:hypothetical protein
VSLTPLTFTPATGLKDSSTFPEPATEAAARAQMQELHDQTKTYVASLISELLSSSSGKGASQIGIEDSSGIFAASNVEAALAENARRAVLGHLGTITSGQNVLAFATAQTQSGICVIEAGAIDGPDGMWDVGLVIVPTGQASGNNGIIVLSQSGRLHSNKQVAGAWTGWQSPT